MTQNYKTANPPEALVDPQANIEHADPFRRLVAIMDRLRGPGGCPWDREQTHQTLQQYLIEESYEVLDAIADEDDAELREELGDVLLQVVFHAQLAAEEKRFGIDDVCRAICEKLIRRHPHVFGATDAADAGEVLRNWEQIKLQEKADKAAAKEGAAREEGNPAADSIDKQNDTAPIFKGIPRHLPALQRAARTQEKAARVGFDWPNLEPVLEKIKEEWHEWLDELNVVGAPALTNPHLDPERLPKEFRGNQHPCPTGEGLERITDELGDLLFAITNAARFLGVEPEAALQQSTQKFIERFSIMQNLTDEAGVKFEELSLDDMDLWWEKAKFSLRNNARKKD
jgi:MazG family protein